MISVKRNKAAKNDMSDDKDDQKQRQQESSDNLDRSYIPTQEDQPHLPRMTKQARRKTDVNL